MLKYFYITNDPEVARIADKNGADRIFIDLERIGKEQRQPMDTVKNYHSLSDIEKVRPFVKNAELLVRINPFYDGTKEETDKAISYGADVIMLPMWTSAREVNDLVNIVDGRTKVLPLLETDRAAKCIDEVLDINGIDEIHIGLNDLSISMGRKNLFELFCDGTVDALADKCKEKNMTFGVGGVGAVDVELALSAKNILAEHYRIGSEMVILSRAFCNRDDYDSIEDFENSFINKIDANREYEKFLAAQSKQFFEQTHNQTIKTISEIIK